MVRIARATAAQALLPILEANMPGSRPERFSTNLTGCYRTPRGFECGVDVDDVSLGGCRVDDLRGGLMLGEYVQITIAEAGPFVAEVAWRQSSRVGLQFNRPIPAHIVKELTGVDPDARLDEDASEADREPAAPSKHKIPTPFTPPSKPANPAARASEGGVSQGSSSASPQTSGARRFL